MSVTDLGYGSNNINCNRESTDLYETNNPCMSDNWLFASSNHQLTINATRTLSYVWIVCTGGYIGNSNAYTTTGSYITRSSLFLDPKVKIKSGEGTSTKPYILTQ